MKGLTFYICFGKYGGFRFDAETNPLILRLCLGWIAISLWRMDIESILEHYIMKEKKAR